MFGHNFGIGDQLHHTLVFFFLKKKYNFIFSYLVNYLCHLFGASLAEVFQVGVRFVFLVESSLEIEFLYLTMFLV